ncbi:MULTISPECIES: universal stress protein [unclassified Marinobacterium]|uniref:universal stress protein n=1 Tax=unclassified Marinobacterium TaxID=2644139 RepID=UPI001567FDC4|nr:MULTISPECIES: universal stress protein [unclassified Marinobacterium]NRP58224.1 Universal stress protein family protein [Marinobacterium sp. xm-d-510]NRP97424.1 Universal stress protein family protein [Marinobacterium sp. xm-a-127]
MTHVVACIDGIGERSEAVCDTAAWASRVLQAPLKLLHVLDKREFPTEEKSQLSGTIGLGARESLLEELASLDEQRGRIAREQGRVMLNAALDRANQDRAFKPSTSQRHGDLQQTLEEEQSDTRLLVLGKGAHGDAMGVHIEPIIRALHRPILITDTALVEPKRFMIAYDGSKTARKALDMVAKSPLLKEADCELLMVGPATFDFKQELEIAEKVLVEAGFNVNATLAAGEAEEVILEHESKTGSELLVMGAYGHSRIRQMLVGSTTTSLLRRTPTPVLLLR